GPFPVPSGWSDRHQRSRHWRMDSFMVPGDGKEKGEGGMPGHAVTLDQPLVSADDGLGNRQAQPGAVGAAADHGVEDAVEDGRRNARSVVADLQSAYQPVAPRADGELAQGTGAQGDPATAV